jgi:putative spermidine/putrescine transport system permease protein
VGKIDLLFSWIVTSVIVVGLLFVVAPLLVTISLSFDARDYLGPFPPEGFSLRWYASFFSNAYYLHGLLTSLIVSGCSSLLAVVSGVSAAVVLSRSDFIGKNFLSVFFLSPLVVPGVVIGFALLILFSRLGLIEGIIKLVLGHLLITVPYCLRATLTGLSGIKRSIIEAALSLGANEHQAFWDVTLPLAKTSIVAGAVFGFAFSMDDVAVSLFLVDAKNVTLSVAMMSMIRAHFDLTIAAAAVLLMGFTLALVLFLDKVVGLDKLLGRGMYR